MKNPLEVLPGLTRREMILRLASGAAAGIASTHKAVAHPIYQHLIDAAVLTQADAEAAKPVWTPKYLDAQQNETVILLAERIVPGSNKAQVNRFIDLLLSVDTSENQRNFSDSLSVLDQEATQRFGQVFRVLSEARQNEVLTALSTESANPVEDEKHSSKVRPNGENGSQRIQRSRRDHFENLKHWVTGAYYSSEVGMRELGWTGDCVFENFSGCVHPEGHH